MQKNFVHLPKSKQQYSFCKANVIELLSQVKHNNLVGTKNKPKLKIAVKVLSNFGFHY